MGKFLEAIPGLSAIIGAVKGFLTALFAFFAGRQSRENEYLKEKIDKQEQDLDQAHNLPRTRGDVLERLRAWRKKLR